jgi:hypothetical protein
METLLFLSFGKPGFTLQAKLFLSITAIMLMFEVSFNKLFLIPGRLIGSFAALQEVRCYSASCLMPLRLKPSFNWLAKRSAKMVLIGCVRGHWA